jgi:hypothetical protein
LTLIYLNFYGKLKEERGEIKSNNQRLENLKEILNVINIEKNLKHIREDREMR